MSHSFLVLCSVFVSAVVHSFLLCCLIGVLKNNQSLTNRKTQENIVECARSPENDETDDNGDHRLQNTQLCAR